jgi:sulfur transfer protein SufE
MIKGDKEHKNKAHAATTSRMCRIYVCDHTVIVMVSKNKTIHFLQKSDHLHSGLVVSFQKTTQGDTPKELPPRHHTNTTPRKFSVTYES